MPERARILVVDDESSIRLVLRDRLSQAGYEVTTAASGEEALGRLQEAAFDLMLLDLKMPGIDGLQVMEQATDLAPGTGVIILTAHATLDSAVQAMRHGGDDYLVKPASTEEILASVEKGLAKRRKRLRQGQLVRQIRDTALQLTTEDAKAPEHEEVIEERPRFLWVRELLLDRERLAITMRGRPLDLTSTEFKLLLCLMENSGRTASFAQMSEAIHGVETHEILARSAISTHIWRLRRKLEEAAPGEAYIVNVRRRGYKLLSE
jgi:DNA-binding response OmpR family regulator